MITCDKCLKPITDEHFEVIIKGQNSFERADLCAKCMLTVLASIRTTKTGHPGLPADAPIDAKPASYDIQSLCNLLKIPPTTLTKMLRRAGVADDSFIGLNKRNQPIRCYNMDERNWFSLMTEVRKYRPRKK